jgi:hypothetical protein
MLGFGFSAGCGKKNADSVQASLSGKVSLSGKPVTGGQLIFHKDGKEVTNLKINPDGTYEGLVPIGDLQVGVETETLKKQLEDMASAGGRGGSPTGVSFSPKDMEKFKDKKMSPEDMMKMAMSPANLGKYVPIPEKYRNPQQSGLAVTTKVGKQEKDFDIP